MDRSRALLVAVSAAAVLAAGGLAPTSTRLPPGGQERTLADGVYTEEQAERGARVYERACQECHEADEYKGFLRSWTGLPVSFFYQIVSSTMPQDNPGGLSRDEYADVLTYIFSINDTPTGDEEMDSDAEALEAITITVPPEDG